jgi:hypothetical protein
VPWFVKTPAPAARMINARAVLASACADEMVAAPVSTRVNHPKHDDAQCLAAP